MIGRNYSPIQTSWQTKDGKQSRKPILNNNWRTKSAFLFNWIQNCTKYALYTCCNLQITTCNRGRVTSKYNHKIPFKQIKEEWVTTSIEQELIVSSDSLSWFTCSLNRFRSIAIGHWIKWVPWLLIQDHSAK